MKSRCMRKFPLKDVFKYLSNKMLMLVYQHDILNCAPISQMYSNHEKWRQTLHVV